MTVGELYRVLIDDNEVIIGEGSPYGLITRHVGKLRDCDSEYMNSQVRSVKGWSHGVIIEI